MEVIFAFKTHWWCYKTGHILEFCLLEHRTFHVSAEGAGGLILYDLDKWTGCMRAEL